jgi:hypothetical protein
VPFYRQHDRLAPAIGRARYVAINNCCRQQQSSNLASVSQSNKKKGTSPEKRSVDQASPIQDGYSSAPRTEELKEERSSSG